MKIIFTASNVVEAHIVAGMLQSEGIKTYVGGHFLQGAIGDLSPMDFATVSVAEAASERAAQLVREYEASVRLLADDIEPH